MRATRWLLAKAISQGSLLQRDTLCDYPTGKSDARR